jgi:hypothetical protein
MKVVDEAASAGDGEPPARAVDAAAAEHRLADESRPERRRFWTDAGFPVEVVTGALVLVIRAWQSWAVPPMVFQDSLKNLESARYGILDGRLWFGQRTPLVPIVLKLTGSVQSDVAPFITFQVIAGAVAFTLLAATVGRALPSAWRWVALATISLFGLTTPITMWDHVILTESLSLTCLVLATTTGLWLLERRTWARVWTFLGACTLLVMVRDTHIVLTGLLALGILVVALIRRMRTKVFPAMEVTLVVVLLALSVFGRVSTVGGERHVQPTRETLFVKILPYTDRFEWFAAHGMPQADRLRELRGGIYPDAQTHTPLFPLPNLGDPGWDEFNSWVVHDANNVYNRWLVTHPVEALADFFRRPEMVWNSAGGSWVFYRNPAFKEFKLLDVDVLLFPPLGVVAVLGVAAGALLLSTRPRWWREPVGVTSLVLLATGAVHNVVNYLGDPAELSRHALVSIVQIRLGFLLLILFALPSLSALRRPRTAAAPAD